MDGQSVTGPLQDKGPCSKASYLLGTVKEEIRTFIPLTLNIILWDMTPCNLVQ